MKSRVMQLDGEIVESEILCIALRSGIRTGIYTLNGEKGLCIELEDGWYQFRQGIVEDYDAGRVAHTFLTSSRPSMIPMRGGGMISRKQPLSKTERLELVIQKYHALFQPEYIRPDKAARVISEERRLWESYQKISGRLFDN